MSVQESMQIQKVQPGIPSQQEIASLEKMAVLAAKSAFYKDINGMEKAAAVMLQGWELGMTPMAALRNISIIDGKPTLSSNLMAALVLRHGHPRVKTVELSDQKCTLRAKRAEETEWEEYTYTWKDAEKAGLTNKYNWKNHPKSMLYARCMGIICRIVFPDLFAGVYAPEEIQSGAAEPDNYSVNVITGEVVESEPSQRVINAAEKFGAKVVDETPAIPAMGVNEFLDWITTRLKLGNDPKEAAKFVSGQLGWTNLNDRKKHIYEGGDKDPYRTMLHEIVSHFAKADGENFNWRWDSAKGEPVELEDIPFNQGETAAEPVTAEVVPF